MNTFATGAWGRFAQFGSLSALLIALVLIVISYWLKKDAPDKAKKLRNTGVWIIGLIPILFLLVTLVIVILFAIFWMS